MSSYTLQKYTLLSIATYIALYNYYLYNLQLLSLHSITTLCITTISTFYNYPFYIL